MTTRVIRSRAEDGPRSVVIKRAPTETKTRPSSIKMETRPGHLEVNCDARAGSDEPVLWERLSMLPRTRCCGESSLKPYVPLRTKRSK